MSHEDYSAAIDVARRPISVSAVLQAVTLATVFGSLGIGKGAYEAIRDELVSGRIEQAKTTEVLSGMAMRDADQSAALAEARATIGNLEMRITKLETSAVLQDRAGRR